MALFRPAGQLKQLQTLVFKGFQLFNQGSARIKSRSRFLPITWNFGKTLVTSNVYFKSDSNKTKLLVTKDDIKISELDEIEEDETLILVDPKTKRYKCTYKGCSKSYTNNSNLQRHIKDKHLKLKPHKCHYEDCSKSFVYESELKRHIDMEHLKPFKCDQCEKSFGSQQNLDQHISDVHLKLKPFECNVCGECFANQQNLDKHKASQHEEGLKLVPCTWPDCGEKFKNSKELATHVKKFHVVTDYQCSKCKMYLASAGSLHNHINKCEDNRNFKCTEYGEAFVHKKTLDDHMKHKHSDETNYVCKVEGCGQAFKSEAALRGHMKSHSDKKPHQCPYCKNAYKTNQDLQSHVFKKHPEEYKEATNDPKVEE